MSSFDALEISRESSRPIELFQFALGSDSYFYTSTADALTVDGQDFTPETITRGRLEQGSDAANRTLIITVPATNAFARLFVNIVPGERAHVTVYRYQRDESPSFNTAVLIFKGIVQSVRFPDDGYTAEIAVRSIEVALNRNVPRFTYMGMCNHFIYDSGCGANAASFNHTGLVTAVNGNVITVAGAGASGFDFVGGYCKPVAAFDYRMVLAVSGNDLTLLLPFGDDLVGTNLQIFAGCDHIIDGDCALVFNRVASFGGFAFVPNRNVFQTGL